MHGSGIKRSHNHFKGHGNVFSDCVRDFSLELIAGSGLKSGNIYSNVSTGPTQHVRGDVVNGVIINNNTIYNLGGTLQNGSLFTVITNSGVELSGAKNSKISNNKFFNVNPDVAVEQAGFGGNATELKNSGSVTTESTIISDNELYNYTEYFRLGALGTSLSDNYKYGGAAMSLTDFGSGTSITNTKQADIITGAPATSTDKIKVQYNDTEYYIAVTAV